MSANAEIIKAFDGFTVNGVEIPVRFMHYDGHGEPYIVFSREYDDNSYSGDDSILGYVTFFDFDIYSKGNMLSIKRAVIDIMDGIGWTWQPSRSSGDMYEYDTGYYHVTLNFAKERGM